MPFIALALLSLCSSILAAQQRGFDYQAFVGLAIVQADSGACMTIRNSSVSAGTPVTLLHSTPAGKVVRGNVVMQVEAACPGDLEEVGDAFYRIAVEPGSLDLGPVYFAILRPASDWLIRDDRAVADLDRDGVAETFRLCFSHEGVHRTVWSGPPLEGVRRWHRYQHLEYATDPDCVEADYRP